MIEALLAENERLKSSVLEVEKRPRGREDKFIRFNEQLKSVESEQWNSKEKLDTANSRNVVHKQCNRARAKPQM